MIFLADVDDTLVRENTTYGFVAHWLEDAGRTEEAKAIRALAERRGVPGKVLAAVHRLLGLDLARRRAVAVLRGATRDSLETAARGYAADLLERAGVESGLARLEEARTAGARVVLVSASLEPAVAALAARLAVEHRASKPAFRQGCCTGRLACDLTGRKLQAVEDLLAQGGELTVMTDNLSDRGLLERADHRIVVLARPEEEGKWDSLEPEFLRVGP